MLLGFNEADIVSDASEADLAATQRCVVNLERTVTCHTAGTAGGSAMNRSFKNVPYLHEYIAPSRGWGWWYFKVS